MPREVKFYNSISSRKEVFTPKNPNEVSIYSCGPTVYNFAHIGNLRSFLFVDVLRRSLKLLGYTLNQTMNITDIDDKIIRESIQKNISIEEFTDPWTKEFFKDLDTMNVERLEHYPKATDSVDEMLEIIDKLKLNGLVYEKESSLYFSISGFEKYGRLSKLDISGIQTGTRYDTDEYTKEDVRDFVLWKAPKDEKERSWDTRHGHGRPGWHLECSAMIRKIYSSGIDIHTGGIDLLFPHHENEIAQTEGAYPEETFVNYWLHCEHLLVDGQKMSKSLGNFYTLRDLLNKGLSPKSIRYLLISSHYRSKLNFSFESVENSKKSLARIQNCLDKLLSITNYEIPNKKATNENILKFEEEFLESLSDDLNTPKALGIVFEAVKTINSEIENYDKDLALETIQFFVTIDKLLSCLEFSATDSIDEKVEDLIRRRAEAKKEKNFALADNIRQELTDMGIILEDTKTGVSWKRK
ncbi:MAG: cysteine--tRNA ligase [Leptospiraceae bacterium]|nr:cysteine--tRNA ligase [Leptospiraceae bacterium]